MKCTYSFKHKPTGVEHTAEIEIDMDALVQMLAARAIGSKNKRASSLRGAVKVRVMPK